MLLLASAAFAATLQVVAPSGRVLVETPLEASAQSVFSWKGAPTQVVAVSREGRWDVDVTTWQGGHERGGLMLSASQRPGGCVSLSGQPSRHALTFVITDGAPSCFEAPVPFARAIARLEGQPSREAGAAAPEILVAGTDRRLALLYPGSKVSWRVADPDGRAWVVQLGVTEIGEAGLDTVVAWRRAEPGVFGRGTRARAAHLPYGETITLPGPTVVALKAAAPH